MLELIQLRQHRIALVLVEGIGELCHLSPDESFLAPALALARAAEAVEGDQIGAKHVHGTGDSADLVIPAAGAFDPRLKVAARQRVQHPDPVSQRCKGTGHVVAETDQHERQEGDHGTDGELADPFLLVGKIRHVLDADEARDQTPELGFLRKHHGGVEALICFDGLQRIDSAQVDELADLIPQSALGSGEETSPAVDDQNRRLGGLFHLPNRFVDTGRIHGRAGDTD